MTAWVCFGFCRGSAFGFFWLRRIGVMADRRHHGEGKHYQGNMAMPSMPGSALVVIEPELVFRGLKTVLDRPPMAFDRHQRFDGCSRWTPGGEEGEIAIGDMTTDQQTARPQTLICAVEFFDLEIGQFEITPIMQPRSFGSGPCRQAFPVGRAPSWRQAATVGSIFLARRRIPAQATEAVWCCAPVYPCKTWSSCSFIRQASMGPAASSRKARAGRAAFW